MWTPFRTSYISYNVLKLFGSSPALDRLEMSSQPSVKSVINVMLVYVKDTLHERERTFVDEEHDGVEGERSHHRDRQAAPEGPAAALAVDLPGAAPPVVVAGLAEAVRLHARLDRVQRHDVPRRHAHHTAGEQHHACTEATGIFRRIHHKVAVLRACVRACALVRARAWVCVCARARACLCRF